MYLARFEFSGEQWLQGSLQLKLCRESTAESPWTQSLARLVAGLTSVSHFRLGYRVSLKESTLDRTLFVLAMSAHEAQLRRCLASFTRLNILAEDSVDIPQTREEHDNLITVFPKYRCQIDLPVYWMPNDLWAVCEFNGRSLLDKLFGEAATNDYELAYHVNFEPIEVGPLLRREARRNALQIHSLVGAPATLVRHQERLARRLDTAAFLADELFGVSSTESAEWLRMALQRYFVESYRDFRIEAPGMPIDEEGHELALLATRHKSTLEESSLQEICSTCLENEDLMKLLSWYPSEGYYRIFGPPAHRWSADPPSSNGYTEQAEWEQVGDLPKQAQGGGDYIFVSYKRGDMSRIAPILRIVAEWGYSVWYDAEIPGGSEWDAVIEERIERSRLVVVFVSQEAIRSRYVRREVKFADALNKVIIPVQLETVDWRHGMGLLLTQLQIVDLPTLERVDRLRTAIQYSLGKA